MAATAEVLAEAPPEKGAWTALAVLTLVNLLNYLDRFVLPAVMEPIRRSELRPTDTQLGVLSTAFIFVYMLSAPLFGLAATRVNRPKLLAAGVAVWSVATALGGFAQSYHALLGARALVGIGEASYATIAPALLADYFPERLRGRVFAVFFAATPVGAALGYILGGYVGAHYGWREAFFVAGTPGLVLAVFAAMLHDATPRESTTSTRGPAATNARPTVATTYGPLLRNHQFVLTVLGYAAYTFALGGISIWMPSFLERVRGVPGDVASTQLGELLVVTGLVGTFVGGWIADWLRKRTTQAYLWLSAIPTLLATPFAYAALASPSHSVYFTSLVIAELLIFACTGPINSAIVGEVEPALRAPAMALAILSIHLLGDVPSPYLIGRISDATSLGRAVMVIPVAVLVGGVIWTWGAIRGERLARVATHHSEA